MILLLLIACSLASGPGARVNNDCNGAVLSSHFVSSPLLADVQDSIRLLVGTKNCLTLGNPT